MRDIKRALLEETLSSIKETFGDTVLLRPENESAAPKTQLSSGSQKLDADLGGGFVRGSIVELYGKESSGKTTLALKMMSRAQALEGSAAIIDAEHTFDMKYALSCGVDASRLWLSAPSSAEEALSICEQLVKSQAFDVIILDSVAALVSKLELEGEVKEDESWIQAELLAQTMRRISRTIAKSKTVIVFINQLRDRPRHLYFEGETTPGGSTLKFMADYRIKLCSGEDDFVLAKARKF